MSAYSEQQPEERWSIGSRLAVGTVAGLVAGVGMGVLFHLGTDLLPVIGEIIGGSTALHGWIVHLVVSAVGGLLFAVGLSIPLFRDLADVYWGAVALGIVHAYFMAIVIVGVVLPIAVNVVGVPIQPLEIIPGPGFAGLLPAAVFAVAHIVYGLVLGLVYTLLRDRMVGA